MAQTTLPLSRNEVGAPVVSDRPTAIDVAGRQCHLSQGTLGVIGAWGVTSTLSSLRDTREHFMERGRAFDATELPVPADVLVYTEAEWDRMEQHGRLDPVVWIDGSGPQ